MDGYDNDVAVMDQDQNLVPLEPPRGHAAQRRAGVPARRGRPPAINRGVPTSVQSAFRSINSTYERVRVLETENGLLRSTNSELEAENGLIRNANSELQQDVFIVRGDLQETQRSLSTITQERDTAREELELFKVTKEEIKDFSLQKLAVGQIATASAHNIYVSELASRVDDFVTNANFAHSKYVIDCCPICLDNTNMPNMALAECGHTVCHSCSRKMEQPFDCPRCRCTSAKMIKLFGMSQV
jgi:hypothetical protein